MDSLNLTDDLLKQKLAYLCESFSLQNMHDPITLT